MVTPDAPTVRAQLPDDFPWDELSYGDDTQLQPVVNMANAYVAVVTGRPLDATMPPQFDPLALQAVTLRTLQVVEQNRPGYIATAADDLIQSFTAGSYSESRVDRTRRGEQKTVNPWPGLNDLLWLLMTDDQLAYWIWRLSGVNPPAFDVMEIPWGSPTVAGLAYPHLGDTIYGG